MIWQAPFFLGCLPDWIWVIEEKLCLYRGPENPCVKKGILFQNAPLAAFGQPKCLLHHWGIAWINQFRIFVVFDKIEKDFKKGVLETLGGLFLALGILGQKLKDVI